MPLTLPRTVEESLGHEAARDFALWFETILVERAVHRDEYREVLSRLDILEHDMADVKTAIRDLHRTMDERFQLVDERFDRMNDALNERFDRMNERFDQMYERMTAMIRWTVGTLALLGTIMSILLAIAQFA